MKKTSYEVSRRIEWDMAHRIPMHGGKCCHLHGHRYAAEVVCRGRLDEMGAVVDFGLVKQLVGGWVDDHWDHNTVYQQGDEFMEALERAALDSWPSSGPARRVWYPLDAAPTAENLAAHLHRVATRLLQMEGIEVVRVRLWETPNCWAAYEPAEED